MAPIILQPARPALAALPVGAHPLYLNGAAGATNTPCPRA